MRALGQRRLSWQPAAPMQGGVLAEGPQSADVYGIPQWRHMNDRERIRALRELSEEYANDPRIRWKAAEIVQGAGASPRDYPAQAQALLRWVQDNVYYTHEVREQLQTPWRTMQVRTGDCDDSALLLASLAKSIGLNYRYILAGRGTDGKMARWVEGEPFKRATYFHIYAQLGWPGGGAPTRFWASAEPTLRGAPLGYDMVLHGIDIDAHGRARVPRQTVGDMMGVHSRGNGAPMTWSPQHSGMPGFYGDPGAQLDKYTPIDQPSPFFTTEFWQGVALRTFEAVVSAVAIYAVMRYVEGRKR